MSPELSNRRNFIKTSLAGTTALAAGAEAAARSAAEPCGSESWAPAFAGLELMQRR